MELQQSTVEEKTFRLLETMMVDRNLDIFYLVGGTALALRLGHRKSIDLDLFSQSKSLSPDLEKYLVSKYNFKRFNKSGDMILQGFIDNVKVDFVAYEYPLIGLITTANNIRLASLEDIVAMKFVATTDSGTRLKDFVDIAYLSTKFSLNQMLGFYQQKYAGVNTIAAIKGLTYYNDIDFELEVELTDCPFNWTFIKNRLLDMVENKDKIFLTPPARD